MAMLTKNISTIVILSFATFLSIVLLVRYYATNTAPRILNVTFIPWYNMQMKMHNRLSCGFSTVAAYIVPIWLVFCVQNGFNTLYSVMHGFLQRVRQIEIGFIMPFWYQEDVAISYRITIVHCNPIVCAEKHPFLWKVIFWVAKWTSHLLTLKGNYHLYNLQYRESY